MAAEKTKYPPITAYDTKDLLLLVKKPYRVRIGGISKALESDQAVPLDQLLALIASAISGPAGTGANSIVIYGIDANRVSQTEVVTMNGVTNVVTATTWLGINRVAVYLAGSTFTNVGNITITATVGGTVQAYVPAGKGTTQQLIFFTQDSHQFLADWLILDAEKTGGGGSPIVQFRGWVWSALSNCKYEVFYNVVNTAIETEHELNPSQPFVISEKSVFWIEATTDTNNTVVTGRFSGIEFRDVDA